MDVLYRVMMDTNNTVEQTRCRSFIGQYVHYRSFIGLSLLLQTSVWGDLFDGAVASLTASGIVFAVALPAMVSAGLLLSIHIYLICTNQVQTSPLLYSF